MLWEYTKRLQFVVLNNFLCLQHELRTPMQGIMGVTGMLLQQNRHLEQQSDTSLIGSLKLIMASSGLLLNLINNLLDVKKFDSESEFCFYYKVLVRSE